MPIDIPAYGPDIAPQPLATRPQGGGAATAAAFGGAGARGLEALGAGLAGASDEASRMVLEQRARLNEARAKEADVAFTREMIDVLQAPDTGYFSTRGSAAIDRQQPTITRLEQLAEKYEASLPNQRAKELFRSVAAGRLNSARQTVSTHAAAELRQYQSDASEARLALSRDEAIANYTDARIVARAINTGLAEIDDLSTTLGLPPEKRDLAKNEWRSGTLLSIVGARADVNVGSAKDFLKAARAGMTGADQVRAADYIRAAERRADDDASRARFEARATLAEAVNDHVSQAQRGVPFTRLTRDDFAAAYKRDEATRRFEDYSRAVDLGRDIGAIRTLPPADAAALIKAAEPRAGSSFAAQADYQDALRKAYGAFAGERERDPIGFAQSTGRLPPEPLTFADTDAAKQNIARRVAAAGEMASVYGTPNVIMTPDEKAFLSRQMSEAVPPDQFALARQIMASSPDRETYRKIMGEIAPGAPVISFAASLLADNDPEQRRIAATIVAGDAALSGKAGSRAINPPTDERLRQRVADEIGEALPTGAAADDLFATIRAAYAGAMVEAGDLNDQTISAPRLKAAIRSVFGETVDYHGRETVTPRGMSKATFRELADVRVPQALEAAGLKQFSKSGKIQLTPVADNPGRYWLVAGTGYMVDKEGQPIAVDMR